MPNRSKEWQVWIMKLMEEKGMSFRDVERAGNFEFTHTTVGRWKKDGIVPMMNINKLPFFLEAAFGRDNSIVGCNIIHCPLPVEWQVDDDDPLKTGLLKYLHITTIDGKITDKQRNEANIYFNKLLDELEKK